VLRICLNKNHETLNQVSTSLGVDKKKCNSKGEGKIFEDIEF